MTVLSWGSLSRWTVVYWSDERSDNWWLGEVQRLLQPNDLVGGTSALIRLLNLPGLMFFYLAGVAALAGRRPALVGRLFSEVTVRGPRGQLRASEGVTPGRIYSSNLPSLRLFEVLEPLFVGQLGLGREEFAEHWETFETLGLADALFWRAGTAKLDAYLHGMQQVHDALADVEHYKGTNDADGLENAEQAARYALDVATDSLAEIKRVVWCDRLHVRVRAGERFTMYPMLAQALLDQLTTQQSAHWIVRTGLFGGNWEHAWATLTAVSESLGEESRRTGHGMYFWIDTGEMPTV